MTNYRTITWVKTGSFYIGSVEGDDSNKFVIAKGTCIKGKPLYELGRKSDGETLVPASRTIADLKGVAHRYYGTRDMGNGFMTVDEILAYGEAMQAKARRDEAARLCAARKAKRAAFIAWNGRQLDLFA
jgi:hypothetical protein